MGIEATAFDFLFNRLIFTKLLLLQVCKSGPENLLLFDLKMEHFGAVFKPDLTDETRTQLQEEEAIVVRCLPQHIS